MKGSTKLKPYLHFYSLSNAHTDRSTVRVYTEYSYTVSYEASAKQDGGITKFLRAMQRSGCVSALIARFEVEGLGDHNCVMSSEI